MVGLIVPPSHSDTPIPTLGPMGQPPVTRPHLLVPELDMAALLKRRLVNEQTRFGSTSPVVMVWALAGVWGRGGGCSGTHTHTQ